jgi:hypothetical protein
VQKSPPAQKAQWSRWLKIGLIAASAMALSIAVAFRLHSDLFDAVFPNRLFVFESEKKPMPDEPKPDLKLPASTDKETPGVSANPLNDASKTVNGTSLKGPEFLITEPEKLITELPEEALKGEQWAWQLSVSSIIIQHGIAPTFAKALDLRQRYPDLSQVRVVPQFVGNESQARFALVSGPYLSKEEAEQYLKSNKTPKDSWVRGVGALQERLLPKSPDAKKP